MAVTHVYTRASERCRNAVRCTTGSLHRLRASGLSSDFIARAHAHTHVCDMIYESVCVYEEETRRGCEPVAKRGPILITARRVLVFSAPIRGGFSRILIYEALGVYISAGRYLFGSRAERGRESQVSGHVRLHDLGLHADEARAIYN